MTWHEIADLPDDERQVLVWDWVMMEWRIASVDRYEDKSGDWQPYLSNWRDAPHRYQWREMPERPKASL